MINYVVKVIFDWILEKVFKYFDESSLKKELKDMDEKLLEEYEKAIQDRKDLTREERRNLALKLLNGG